MEDESVSDMRRIGFASLLKEPGYFSLFFFIDPS